MDTDERVNDPLGDPEDGHLLTRAIIDTIREPLIVLDGDLRIITASGAFYKKFDLTHANTQGKLFYDLGNGQWNIPALRTLLEDIIPKHTTVEGYEIDHVFPFLGQRTMLVNAREIRYDNARKKLLLSILDITDQRILETEKNRLFQQKDLLLKEMRHRIANSLQLIASILMLKAETVDSKESRAHLEDAHERIMSIATVQQQLDPVGLGEDIEVAGYLSALCRSLAASMIGGRKPITIETNIGTGAVSSDAAISFGLIATELVINALKHAFPDGRSGVVKVSYYEEGRGWALSVSDNGVGKKELRKTDRVGLGTSIIGALANKLHASIRTESSEVGTTVSLVHSNV